MAVAQIVNGTRSLTSAALLGGFMVVIPAIGLVGRAMRQHEAMRGSALAAMIIGGTATASGVLFLLM